MDEYFFGSAYKLAKKSIYFQIISVVWSFNVGVLLFNTDE